MWERGTDKPAPQARRSSPQTTCDPGLALKIQCELSKLNGKKTDGLVFKMGKRSEQTLGQRWSRWPIST